MRLLLLALQDERQEAAHDATAGRSSRTRIRQLEEEQCLALMRAMRDGGRVAPLLVCTKGSSLHRKAAALHLPLLAAGSAGSPLTLMRLWLWQRKHNPLLIQTIGEEALTLGRRVLAMRKAGSAMLCHAFFLRPPAAERCQSKDMLAAGHIFCGSEHVRSRLQEAWAQKNAHSHRPELHILHAGMDMEGYSAAPPFSGQASHAAPDGTAKAVAAPAPVAGTVPQGSDAAPEPAATARADRAHGPHFIFGMGDSLIARSGAISVVRAMAAIWQRTDLPRWEMRMLGEGPRFQEVLSEACNLGVQSRLCLLGEQDLPAVLRHCHAWLAPGSSPEEELSTLWAGWAAGLPVICSDTEGHREKLSLGDDTAAAALLTKAYDPQSLARAMIDIMHDAPLRSALAAAGRARIPFIRQEHMAAEACRFFERWLQELAPAQAPEPPVPPAAATAQAHRPERTHAVPQAESTAPHDRKTA